MKHTKAVPPDAILNDLRAIGEISDGDRFFALQGGRTNQVWQITGDGKNRVLKLYRPDQINPMFRNDPQSEAICLGSLDGTGLAPKLLGSGRHKAGHWIIYSHINGQIWQRDPALIAKVLAKVHREPPPKKLTFGPNGSSSIELQAHQILTKCKEADFNSLSSLIPTENVPQTNKLCLIHGDPVPGNIVISPKGPILIDWQCPAIGDPAEDLAIFLSPAMQLLYRGSPLSKDEEQRFLSAYPNTDTVKRYQSLKLWYHWRMAAYCLWQMGQGDADYAAGLRLECAQLGGNSFNNLSAP